MGGGLLQKVGGGRAGGRLGIGTTNAGSAYASVSSPSTFTGATFQINSESTGDVISIANNAVNVMIIKKWFYL